jgi:hypothetical protein
MAVLFSGLVDRAEFPVLSFSLLGLQQIVRDMTMRAIKAEVIFNFIENEYMKKKRML